MRRFFKSMWFRILAGILAVLVLFTIIAGVSSSRGNPLSSTIGVVAQPFEYVAGLASRGALGVKHFFTRSSTYEAEIAELEEQVLSLQNQLADYDNTKAKLEQYEAYLGIQEQNPDYQVISATVMGRDASNNYTTFLLSKGSASGVAVNDPVIYGGGQLVGVVTKVSLTYCVVSTILDPNISVSSYDTRTQESGYLNNTTALAADGLTRLAGLDRDTAVSTGGVICTAGVGGIYPRDLIIGTVTEVRNDDYDISAYAVIEPSVDITEITQVLIITDFEGQGISVTTDINALDGEDEDGEDTEDSSSASTAGVSAPSASASSTEAETSEEE